MKGAGNSPVPSWLDDVLGYDNRAILPQTLITISLLFRRIPSLVSGT
jgi:hypothetical protein